MAVPGGVFTLGFTMKNCSGASTHLFQMRNLHATKSLYLRRIKIEGRFTGAATVAETDTFLIGKFDTATASATGATSVVPTRHSSRWATATIVTSALFKVDGLVTPGTIKGTAFGTLIVPPIAAVLSTTSIAPNLPGHGIYEREFYRRDIKRPQYWQDELELLGGTATTAEGLTIYAAGTLTGGTDLTVEISWEEAA